VYCLKRKGPDLRYEIVGMGAVALLLILVDVFHIWQVL
jgi:hypothetical protein